MSELSKYSSCPKVWRKRRTWRRVWENNISLVCIGESGPKKEDSQEFHNSLKDFDDDHEQRFYQVKDWIQAESV